MTTVRIIKEKVRLDACVKDDRIRVSYSPNSSWASIGAVTLLKIKPLAKEGMAQIKFKSRYGKNAKVHKADLPMDTMVEREREATDADSPDAGTPIRETLIHNGVVYEKIRPEADAKTPVAAATERQRPRAYDPVVDDLAALIGSPAGGAIAAYVLGTAAMMAGTRLERMDVRIPSAESFAAVDRILGLEKQD